MHGGGLFVGVARQLDESFPALKFAARDAEVLWAMLADGNDAAGEPTENARLLVNQLAVRSGVLQALSDLQLQSSSRPFDFLHVHFSCHGSPDGRLILCDTLQDSIATSGLALGELTAAIGRIHSALTLLTLDTCFAGTVEGLQGSENAEGYEALLGGFATESRAVAWAAAPDEQAYESERWGHGYFSYGLIVSMRKAREAQADRIEAATWIAEAIAFTQAQARSNGRIQNPQAVLRLRAGQSIRVPADGARQRVPLASQGVLPVTDSPEDLCKYGWSTDFVECLRRRCSPGGHLNSLQVKAIAPAGVIAGANVLVCAPTSAGKTVVGELGVLARVRQGRKAVILLPSRALVHEQAARFADRYSSLDLRVIQSAGDAHEQDAELFGQHFDVAFITFEKFAALAVLKPAALDAVGVVVLDEAHMIRNKDRGPTVELIIAGLQARRRRSGQALQIIALCANVDDVNRLHEWISAEIVGASARPVPLTEVVVCPSGRLLACRDRGSAVETREDRTLRTQRPGGHDSDFRAALAEKVIARLVSDGKQVIAFVGDRRRARSLARRFADSCASGRAANAIRALDDLVEADGSLARRHLRELFSKGVAFHTADLDRSERAIVEEGFATGEVRLLVATTTLAMGVNTPADATVIVDNALFDGRNGEKPIDVLDYRNMAGRAGRLGAASEGTAYLIAVSDGDGDQLFSRYVRSASETLTSQLDTLQDFDLTIAMLLLLGEGSVIDIALALQRTYCGYLKHGDASWLRGMRVRIERALEGLLAVGVVDRDGQSNYSLSSVGKICASSGLRVSSAIGILRVVDEMAKHDEPFEQMELLALVQLTDELKGTYTPMRRGEETSWTAKKSKWMTSRPVLVSAFGALAERARTIKRMAGLWGWISGRPVRDVECLYDDSGREPTLGRIRTIADRTVDLIWPVASLVALRLPESADSIHHAAEVLRARLEFGAQEKVLPLLRTQLVSRSESTGLVAVGVESEEQLALALAAPEKPLAKLLSDGRAEAIRNGLSRRRGKPRRTDHATFELFSGT